MKRIVLILIMSCFIANSCQNSFSSGENKALYIRIENTSKFDFDKVWVAFPKDEIDYGTVLKKTSSGYQKIKSAYRYAYIKVWANNQTCELQPIDYVGETLLDDGYYTYFLELDTTGTAGKPGYLSLKCIKN